MNSNKVYSTYAHYIKQSICLNYDINPYVFIDNVTTNLDLKYELTGRGNIVFFFALNTIRVEIKVIDYKDFNYHKLICRILDYTNIWRNNNWGKRYVLYSDVKKDKRHFIKKDIKTFLETK